MGKLASRSAKGEDEIPEHYDKLETSAVLFERQMDWLVLSGPDRVSWLQGMVSNDVARLRPGQGCPAAHLSPQGKVMALMAVLADREHVWILAEHQPDPELLHQLDRLLIMEDAALEDRSPDVRVFSLIGGGAAPILDSVLAVRLDALYDHRASGDARVLRTPIGYDLVVSRGGADGLRSRMEAAGAVPGEESLREIVWIERGIPRWGVDVDPTVTLPELGEDAIDYEKGCYVGQEAVAKIRYLGHVNRALRGLRIDGDLVPEPGPIHRGDREAGRLTSAARSPRAGGVIGLGYLRRGSDAPGTEVEIVRGGNRRAGVVVELPFLVSPSA